eukprot:1122454-Prorocentrum_minimum.AAC.1
MELQAVMRRFADEEVVVTEAVAVAVDTFLVKLLLESKLYQGLAEVDFDAVEECLKRDVELKVGANIHQPCRNFADRARDGKLGPLAIYASCCATKPQSDVFATF